MKFTEAQLEAAIIQLLGEVGYPHVIGAAINRQPDEVLIKEDLRAFLAARYAADNITPREIESVIRKLTAYSAADLYESNKAIMKLVADGFLLKREDRNQKDLYVQLIDYSALMWDRLPACHPSSIIQDHNRLEAYPTVVAEKLGDYRTNQNRFKLVNQLEIVGSEKRIPDGILYINGLPLVVFEFKSAIKEEGLIQTISRVNRKYEQKLKGLVVDYIGIKKQMNLALAQYSKGDQGNFEEVAASILVVKDHLDLLKAIFHRFDTKPYFSGQPMEQLHCLNMAAEFVQVAEAQEQRFMNLTKRMKAAYDICVGSDGFTQDERDHVHFYLAIRSIVFKLTKGDAPDIAQMNAKVQQMLADALASDGVEEIFKVGQGDIAQVDLFDPDYLAKIDKIKLPNTKIKLLQQLLAKAIDSLKKVNKLKGVDFSKQFTALVEKYNDRSEHDVLQSTVLEDFTDEIIDLYHKIREERESFAELGIDFEEKAFYDILKALTIKYDFEYPEEKLLVLAKKVKVIVDDKAKYTDWSQRNDIKAELKVDLIILLAEHGYPPIDRDEVYKDIFEQAENFKKYQK